MSIELEVPSDLFNLYRTLESEEPSRSTDEAILRAARRQTRLRRAWKTASGFVVQHWRLEVAAMAAAAATFLALPLVFPRTPAPGTDVAAQGPVPGVESPGLINQPETDNVQERMGMSEGADRIAQLTMGMNVRVGMR